MQTFSYKNKFKTARQKFPRKDFYRLWMTNLLY